MDRSEGPPMNDYALSSALEIEDVVYDIVSDVATPNMPSPNSPKRNERDISIPVDEGSATEHRTLESISSNPPRPTRQEKTSANFAGSVKQLFGEQTVASRVPFRGEEKGFFARMANKSYAASVNQLFGRGTKNDLSADFVFTSAARFGSARIELGGLPQQLGQLLSKYDEANTGNLEGKALDEAARDLGKMRDMVNEGRIPISVFPEQHHSLLKEFGEGDGNDELSADEILQGFKALKTERKRSSDYWWMAWGLLVFSVCLIAAMSVTMTLVLEHSKETKVVGSGMMTKQTHEPVQVASSDFTMVNGVMVNRASADGSCSADHGQCGVQPIQTAQTLQEARLSSQMRDPDLRQLKALTISNADVAWIHFQVLAVARYPEPSSRHGTVVVLYTHLGELTLDGTEVSFHESLAGAFSRAGFDLDSRGRRLLGVIETMGFFNLLSGWAFDGETAGLGANATADIEALLEGLPRTFKADVTIYTLCEDDEEDGGNDCLVGGVGEEDPQTLADHVSSYLGERTQLGVSAVPALIRREKQYFMKLEGGNFAAKTVVENPQFPGQIYTEVFNMTHMMTFQTFQSHQYFCKTELSDEVPRVLAEWDEDRETLLYNGKLVDRDYNVTDLGIVEFVGGQLCRKLKLVVAMEVPYNPADGVYDENSDMVQPESMTLHVWLWAENKTLFQIQFGNVVHRYNQLQHATDPIPNSVDDDELVFNLGWFESNCPAAEDLHSPTEWTYGELLDTQYPEEEWGQLIPANNTMNQDELDVDPEYADQVIIDPDASDAPEGFDLNLTTRRSYSGWDGQDGMTVVRMPLEEYLEYRATLQEVAMPEDEEERVGWDDLVRRAYQKQQQQTKDFYLIKYTLGLYYDTSTGERKVEFTLDSSQKMGGACMSKNGQIYFLYESGSPGNLIISGQFGVKMDVIKCLRRKMPGIAVKAIDKARLRVQAGVDLGVGMSNFYEDTRSCSRGRSPAMGTLQGVPWIYGRGYVRGSAGKKKVKVSIGGDLSVYGMLPVNCGSRQSGSPRLKVGAGADITLKITVKIWFFKVKVSFGVNIFPNIVNSKACTDSSGIYNFRSHKNSQRFPNKNIGLFSLGNSAPICKA